MTVSLQHTCINTNTTVGLNGPPPCQACIVAAGVPEGGVSTIVAPYHQPAETTGDLRTDLSSLAESFRQKAEDGRASLYPGSDLRWCAEQIDIALSRHAPTDPAPPPASDPQASRATIPDGVG